MTRPGDPGYAAEARSRAAATGGAALPESHERASGATTGTADHPPRRRWTLERRLVVLIAALLVAIGAGIGVATVLLFHQSSVDRLDASLRAASERATDAGLGGFPVDPRAAVTQFLSVPGQPVGTLGGLVGPSDADALRIAENGDLVQAPPSAIAALTRVPLDGEPHTIDAGPLGEYRALAAESQPGLRIVLGLPLAEVSAQTGQLALTIALVAIAGLLFAIAFGSVIVRRALVPLARMTDTALAVSERPLDRGDVDLDERVPVDDPRTEVGRLGTAFNRMLGHVASSLSAREQSERKVRRFVADASHELRTPLASIRGYAELTRLHGGELAHDVTHAISRIESESLRMTELVEDLLLLARLDEGRELVHSRIDVRTIVVDAVGDAQVAGPDHEWSVEVPDAPVEVAGDDARLRQVLTNLLANARVHTPDGTAVHVAVEPRRGAIAAARAASSTTGSAAAGAGTVRITVVDDGPGIDDGVRERLFERFARGDASRSRRAGSTGLGLAIVRAVVEAHHGTVSVESEPGRTAFTVELPLADAPPVE